MKRLIAVLAVVSSLTAAALAAPSAWAAARSSKGTAVSNGKIVFRRWLNGTHTRGEIFTINPDGTGLFQVTHTPKGASTEPDPSPNGRWIGYMVIQHGDLGTGRLFKIRPNGSHRISLSKSCTGVCQGDGFPDWSSTGLIAFERTLSAHPTKPVGFSAIFLMNANGTDPRQITLTSEDPARGDNPYYDESPAWSPTGRRIAFDRGRNDRTNLHAIFTVGLTGSGLRQITPWRLDASQPQYSPNGRWIAFRSGENSGTSGNILLVHPDGTGLHKLTHTPAGTGKWQSCAFSPDGQFVVSAENPVNNGGLENADVYVIPVTGGKPVDVTNDPKHWDSAPDWGTGRA
jgi:TolB protein